MPIRDKFIIALDQGTTSSRSILVNNNGKILDVERKKTNTYYQQPGWVEQNPIEILEAQRFTLNAIINRNNIRPNDICSIGIANQRETTIIWFKDTGKPAYNAITWQDKRTSSYCEHLKSENIDKIIKEKTGLVLDSYFSATKIKWILDNIPGLRRQAKGGNLLFGTIDSWLLYNLTNNKCHFTDVTNASRTMLFNIHTETWDADLLRIFDIPIEILPEIKPNDYTYGSIQHDKINGVTISSVIGDQQAALFGHLCFSPGCTKLTYGTGCFLMTNTGSQKLIVDNMLTTLAWKLRTSTTYAIEGSIFTAGSAIQWVKNNLLLLNSTKELEELAASVSDSLGVHFIPAFSGLGAPYWDQNARGLIIGITGATTQAHIAKAAIESIAFQVTDLIKYMKIKIKQYGNLLIKVDGGMAQNNFLLQFQADMLQQTIERSEIEATALGTAYIAGLNKGYWSSTEQIPALSCLKFVPKMPKNEAILKHNLWNKAIARSLKFD